VYRQLGALDPRRGKHEPRRPREIQSLLRRLHADRQGEPLLSQIQHPIDGLRSKPWEELSRDGNSDAPELDFVFTVCDAAAGGVCPIWPGQPMSAHWGLPDPAAVEGRDTEKALAFADTYRMLNNRITLFMNLPLTLLSKLSLQERLDKIGQTRDAPARTDG
jgi:arsenate reductase (thioredoxin)